jgi:tetratricopeptide (TPR) repeat protein
MITDVVERYRREREFQIAETSERQRDDLNHLALTQAETAARGASAAEAMALQLSRMAAVADWTLPEIAEHLALTADRLGGIEQMLASPTETAATEYYRRGSSALASGWLEEAESDLSEAVRLYPYNSNAWFNLGVVRQRSDSAESADAFVRSARYAATTDPGLAARAVLVGSSIFRTRDRTGDSERFLREYAQKLQSCAEVELSLGVHHDDPDHLAIALTLAPQLAVDARLSGASRIEEAASRVCRSERGPVAKLRLIEDLAVKLSNRAHIVGLDQSISTALPVELPSDSVGALLLADACVPVLVGELENLASEIEREHKRRSADYEEIALTLQRAQLNLEEKERARLSVEASLDRLANQVSLGRTAADQRLAVKRGQVAVEEFLTAELERAKALERIVASWPQMHAHWTDSDWNDQRGVMLGSTDLGGPSSLEGARTWMEIYEWIDRQGSIQMRRAQNSSDGVHTTQSHHDEGVRRRI